MEERLQEYVEHIFLTVPCTMRAIELKEELTRNLLDKYADLIAEGKSQEDAYKIAIASIGDINELLGAVRPATNPQEKQISDEAKQKEKNKSALLLAISVALYILCPVPCIIWDSNIGVVLMFVMVAIATGLIIYRSITKSTYKKTDDTIVENFKEWQDQDSNKKSVMKAVSSALWALILVAYFVISFATQAWYVTWVIFLIGGAIEGILKAIIDISK